MTQARGVMGQLLRSVYAETGYNYDPTSMAAVKLPFNSYGVRGEQAQNVAATIRGNRNPYEPFFGNINVAGDVVVPVDRFAIGHWLKMAFGTVSTASTGGNLFQHTFTVGSVMDSWVLEAGFTDIGKYLKHSGIKVGGWSLTVGGDAELTMSFNVIGGNETQGTATVFSGTPTSYGTGRYGNFQATLKEGGVALATAAEVSINVSNALDESVYLIGDEGYRGDLPEGLLSVEGSFRAKFETWSLYTMAVSGTERSLEIDFAVGSDQLQIIIDELRYRRQAPDIPSAEGIWQEMPFMGYYSDAAAASAIRAILINSLASY